MHLDFGILNFIQSHLRCNFLDIAMPLFTKLGDGGILWILCSVILLLFPKTRRAGAAIVVSLALESLCCNVILKPLVGRIRPCDVNTSVQLLIPRPADFSFPSGHTGASFAAASALFFSRNKLWIPSANLAVLISFSRLYLYVHYPSDILAGAMLGIMLGWLGTLLVKAFERKFYERKMPIYKQIAMQLEGAILSGTFLPGSRIPAIREIAAEYQVNPNTAQRAVWELKQMKLLVSPPGKGTFVIKDADFIRQFRQKRCEELTYAFILQMKLLGYSNKQIQSMCLTEICRNKQVRHE